MPQPIFVADHVHLFMAKMYTSSNGFFHHDNAACYRAKFVSNWFHDHDRDCSSLTFPITRLLKPLRYGRTGDLQNERALEKSAGIVQCNHVKVDTSQKGMLPASCGIYAMKE